MKAKTTGMYARTSAEAHENAREIYGWLTSWGWSIYAICGMLGNIQEESGLNPWRWQKDNVQSTTGSPWSKIGYGFFQYTPAGNYINDNYAKSFSEYGPNFKDREGKAEDGYAQLRKMDLNQPGQYSNSIKNVGWSPTYHEVASPYYNMIKTFGEYKTAKFDVGLMAAIWCWNWERPDPWTNHESARRESAEYYYALLSGETPTPPDPPEPDPDPDPPDPPEPVPGKLPDRDSFCMLYTRNQIIDYRRNNNILNPARNFLKGRKI